MHLRDPLHFPLGHLPSLVMQQSVGKGHVVALPCISSLAEKPSYIFAQKNCPVLRPPGVGGLLFSSLFLFFVCVAVGKAADRKMTVNLTR